MEFAQHDCPTASCPAMNRMFHGLGCLSVRISPFTLIVQENSAYGNWMGEQETNSTKGLLQLARLAQARSANVCLLLTWATLANTSATNFTASQVRNMP